MTGVSILIFFTELKVFSMVGPATIFSSLWLKQDTKVVCIRKIEVEMLRFASGWHLSGFHNQLASFKEAGDARANSDGPKLLRKKSPQEEEEAAPTCKQWPPLLLPPPPPRRLVWMLRPWQRIGTAGRFHIKRRLKLFLRWTTRFHFDLKRLSDNLHFELRIVQHLHIWCLEPREAKKVVPVPVECVFPTLSLGSSDKQRDKQTIINPLWKSRQGN